MPVGFIQSVSLIVGDEVGKLFVMRTDIHIIFTVVDEIFLDDPFLLTLRSHIGKIKLLIVFIHFSGDGRCLISGIKADVVYLILFVELFIGIIEGHGIMNVAGYS